MKQSKLSLYWKLFSISFSISAFTFGGGYVVIPMLKKYFVDDLELITESELMNMSAIAHTTPGSIAVNMTVLVGYKIAGVPGALLTGIGTVMPPIIILTIISHFYEAFRSNTYIAAILKGMEAGVGATIVDLVINMSATLVQEKNILFNILAPLTFIASFVFGINILLIIAIAAILSYLQVVIKSKRGKLNA